MAFWAYLVVGPGLALFVALGLIAARIRLTKMRSNPTTLPENPPGVIVLVPARNEEGGIAACLRSLLAQDYPNLKVLAIDDRSTDATLERMRAVAAGEGRLEVLAIASKPEEWLGKCHALHHAAQHPQAREAEWLFFVDSDVTVEPGALRTVMAQAVARSLDAVSVLTRQRCETFWEKLLTPVACGAIVGMYMASATNEDSRRKTAFANGQFFLIRRAAYERVGGHERVKNMPTEDVDLMRALKLWRGADGLQHKCRLYAGDDLAETRMYDSLNRMFKGWARIYSGASHRRPWRILVASVFVLSFTAAFVMPLAAGTLGAWWLAASLLHLALVLTSVATIYVWSGNSAGWALLFPLTGVMQLAFFVKALWWCATNKMEWRGTTYSTPGAGVSAPPADSSLTTGK